MVGWHVHEGQRVASGRGCTARVERLLAEARAVLFWSVAFGISCRYFALLSRVVIVVVVAEVVAGSCAAGGNLCQPWGTARATVES